MLQLATAVLPDITVDWAGYATAVGVILAAGVGAAIGLKLAVVGIRMAIGFFRGR